MECSSISWLTPTTGLCSVAMEGSRSKNVVHVSSPLALIPPSHTYTYTHTHTHITHTHTSHTHTHTHTHSHTHILTRTHTHTHTGWLMCCVTLVATTGSFPAWSARHCGITGLLGEGGADFSSVLCVCGVVCEQWIT